MATRASGTSVMNVALEANQRAGDDRPDSGLQSVEQLVQVSASSAST